MNIEKIFFGKQFAPLKPEQRKTIKVVRIVMLVSLRFNDAELHLHDHNNPDMARLRHILINIWAASFCRLQHSAL